MSHPSSIRVNTAEKALKAGRLLLQFVLVIAIYEAGCLLASILPFSVPGNIMGMVLLLVLLLTGLLKARHVDGACNWMLDNMSLFFIPASVGIMGSMALLDGTLLKFLAICAITTVLVFVVTSYTVVAVSRLMRRFGSKAESKQDEEAAECENTPGNDAPAQATAQTTRKNAEAATDPAIEAEA